MTLLEFKPVQVGSCFSVSGDDSCIPMAVYRCKPYSSLN